MRRLSTISARCSLLIAVLALLGLARVAPASAAATPPDSLPATTAEAAVIQETANGLNCSVKPAVTLADPMYVTSCAGVNTSVTVRLERFATAKDAEAAFAKYYPSTGERAQVFHGYRAATSQTSTREATTRTHGWVADRWLIIVESIAPSDQTKVAMPVSISETVYQAALKNRLFS